MGNLFQNLLNNFHQSDVLTVAAKIFLFFQMMTVFPLIMYLLRVSVLFPIYKNVWPGQEISFTMLRQCDGERNSWSAIKKLTF